MRGVRYALVVLIALLLGCVGEDENQEIEIQGHSLQEKLRIGEQLNTPERIERVRASVKKRFPELTDSDLALMYIGFDSDERQPEATRKVMFQVGMRCREGLDCRAIVRYALDMLTPEVAAAVAAPKPPQTPAPSP